MRMWEYGGDVNRRAVERISRDIARRGHLYWEMKTALNIERRYMLLDFLSGWPMDHNWTRFKMMECRLYRDAVEAHRNGRLPRVDPYDLKDAIPKFLARHPSVKANWWRYTSSWGRSKMQAGRIQTMDNIARADLEGFEDVKPLLEETMRIMDRLCVDVFSRDWWRWVLERRKDNLMWRWRGLKRRIGVV